MAQENAVFSFAIDLSAARPMDFNFSDPPAGPHEVVINDATENVKDDGKKSLKVSVSILGGEADGIVFDVYVGGDFSKKGNVGHMMNLLAGLHTKDGKYLPAEKIAGIKAITPELFKGGLRAFVNVKPAPEGEVDENGRKKLADRNFATKPQFDQYVKAFALAKAQPAKPASAASPTPVPAASTPTLAGAAGTAGSPPPAAAGDVASLFGS